VIYPDTGAMSNRCTSYPTLLARDIKRVWDAKYALHSRFFHPKKQTGAEAPVVNEF
jgi:hypothetical protein